MKKTPAYEFADEPAQSNVTIPLERASAVASQRQPSFKALKGNNYLKDIHGLHAPDAPAQH